MEDEGRERGECGADGVCRPSCSSRGRRAGQRVGHCWSSWSDRGQVGCLRLLIGTRTYSYDQWLNLGGEQSHPATSAPHTKDTWSVQSACSEPSSPRIGSRLPLVGVGRSWEVAQAVCCGSAPLCKKKEGWKEGKSGEKKEGGKGGRGRKEGEGRKDRERETPGCSH